MELHTFIGNIYLQHNPKHVYAELNPIALKETYWILSLYRIAAIKKDLLESQILVLHKQPLIWKE